MTYISDDMKNFANDYLEHYGVLGMKWGIRKDKEFRRDLNQHNANKKIRALKKSGRSDIKEQIRRIKRETRAKNKAMNYDYANYKPKKGASRSEIYEKNKQKALKTIPNYKAKHMVRKAGKILGEASIGAGVVSAGLGASVLAAAAKTSLSSVAAQDFITLGAIYLGEATGSFIEGGLASTVPAKIVKGKM